MAEPDERYTAWREWDEATEAFKRAHFPPAGQGSPTLEQKRVLETAMSAALERLKAIDGY
ncbi:hypothetical protein QTH87_23875 [Variovorax sp. J22P168]|uniref:hypothetical protein n=1 Tax=Variovorax jilinensis TaxID=3053513 RepID=UPI0025770D8F|nr:hypothetical protein [Variovorax sp. J22P168]MDM0015500.1 hypothetical protein [Variovorax sp. J22P168]